MAMIKCPECGKEISDKSKKCIYCGCPANFFKNNKKVNNDFGTDTVNENITTSIKKNIFSKKYIIAIAVAVIVVIIIFAKIISSGKSYVKNVDSNGIAKIETEDNSNSDTQTSSETVVLSNKPKEGELFADNIKSNFVYLEVPYSKSGLQNTDPWNARGTAFHLEDTYFLDQKCTVSVWYDHQDTNKYGYLQLNTSAATSAEVKKFSQMRDMLINKYNITLLEDDEYHISFKIPDTKYICKIYVLIGYADTVDDILIVNE